MFTRAVSVGPLLDGDLYCSPLVVNVDMRSGTSWVLANLNVTGYYRVNYDLGNWERLLAQLDLDHEVNGWVAGFADHGCWTFTAPSDP